MGAINRLGLIRFSIALVAEIVLLSSLNFFDDWTLEEMPVKFVAVAMLCGIACFAAVDDFWRYQWEGKIQQAGFNPYVNAPDDPQLEAVRSGFEAWHKINHRDFRAIYP